MRRRAGRKWVFVSGRKNGRKCGRKSGLFARKTANLWSPDSGTFVVSPDFMHKHAQWMGEWTNKWTQKWKINGRKNVISIGHTGGISVLANGRKNGKNVEPGMDEIVEIFVGLCCAASALSSRVVVTIPRLRLCCRSYQSESLDTFGCRSSGRTRASDARGSGFKTGRGHFLLRMLIFLQRRRAGARARTHATWRHSKAHAAALSESTPRREGGRSSCCSYTASKPNADPVKSSAAPDRFLAEHRSGQVHHSS